jgi:hypothetical protein
MEVQPKVPKFAIGSLIRRARFPVEAPFIVVRISNTRDGEFYIHGKRGALFFKAKEHLLTHV